MTAFAEFERGDGVTTHAVVATCFEQGAQAVLIHRDALPAAFFDLRSGLAGELAQRLALYRLRAALVVPDLSAQPARFVEYARESNRGTQVRFFDSRAEAAAWLGTEADADR